jgi:hypothetical protein
MTSDSIFTTLSGGLQAQIINDLMDLFRSNSRGYGVGEFTGARFDEDKNKWIPGHVRWTWGETSEREWHDHLAGVRLLGQGVLCDDNRVWYACLDIDSYDIDYHEEMAKIKRSGLPLVVYRTKSGGLRIVIFFSEAIDSELVIPRMRRVASLLGYAGCEIFPKQSKLDVSNGDCPSWIYMPYGGTGAAYSSDKSALFPEQGCMNEGGGLMELEEGIGYAMSKRLTRDQFIELFAAEEHAKANGKANGRKHPKGNWVQEESYETTINTMFCDGPPCMWTISHDRCRDMQNNFLFNVSTFLRRKYPENWDKALEYVNYNVLQPVGDRDKLNSIVKRAPSHNYQYLCDQEPICGHCNPHACRRMPFGVGDGKGGTDHYELGLTIINTEPRIFIANLGDSGVRLILTHEEIWELRKYTLKCIGYGVKPPIGIGRDEWHNIVNRNIENATVVEPPPIMRANASEIEVMTRWLSIRVPTFMRMGAKGSGDEVRVKIRERRIYFKHLALMEFCRRYSSSHEERMRLYVTTKCEHHTQGPGCRGWFRSKYSILFDVIDEELITKWMADGDPQEELQEEAIDEAAE